MQLFSLTFLFLFLPIAMGLYYITPNKYKIYSMVLISTIYFVMVDVKSLLMVLVSVMFDYLLAIAMCRWKNKKLLRRIFLISGIIKNLGIIIFFSSGYQITGIPPVFGIMVTAFLGMGYIIDVYKKEYAADVNIIRFLSYITFFPSMYYGPLVRYKDVRRQLTRIHPSLTGISKGIVLLIGACAKKVIVADTLVALHNELLAVPKAEFSVLTGWLLMLSFAFSLYFTLCGYLDAARGIGLMFSIDLPNSFYYPFQARSLDDFFARFNISVNEYVRKYVYVQLGGKNNGTVSSIFNILLVSMLIGVWYGLKINCLLWGIYFAVLIILEQYVYKNFWKNMPVFLQRTLTFCATIMSFSIMLGDDLYETWFYLKSMFGFGRIPLYDNHTLYLLYSNLVVLILALLISISLWNKISKYISKKFPATWELFSVIFNVGALVCICSVLL